MRFKIFASIIITSLIVIAFSIFYSRKTIDSVIQQNISNVYENRIKEYKVFYNTKKTFLDSFAKFLSSSDIIKEAYLKNNREMLIKYVKPLYDNLHKSNIIEELHFFKRPAISFVNFANLKKYNFSVAKAREDITWIDTSFQPSTHFYVCRLYPGLRATYPIIYNDRLLGSISFGINIKEFKNLFEQVGANKVSIYLKDSILKKMLLKDKYKQYKSLPLYKGYRVIGDVFNNIKLQKGYEFYNNNLYTKIKIKDFFGNTIGFLVINDDMKKCINNLENILQKKLITEILGLLFILLIVYILFKYIFTKLDELNNILSLIKQQKFSELPKVTKPNCEFDIYKNNLINVGQKIKTYISLLSQKVEEYSDKAYKDGLTNIFNRRFLEEKADELFTKFNINHTPVGIIMLDIDNFKKINDTYGHNIGDLVLINLAKTISNEIRKEDFFIRYGGEEFVLVLPNSNIESTFKIAEKIRKDIESLKINIGSKQLSFTISLGITEIIPSDENLFDAINRADKNLYKAKNNGKNKVEL